MENLRIGICDDEQTWHDRAKQIIESYAKQCNCSVELVFFYNKEEVLKYEGNPLDSVFMDIELEEENGINVARLLNEKWPDCAICYVTNYLFYATDSYQTEHIYFVLKEQLEKKIGSIFDKLFHIQEQAKQKLIFEVISDKIKEISLSPKEILYFERNKRRTFIHTVWGTYAVWDRIGEIENRLPEADFVRCHNSYIVYLPAIREISKKDILMKDGTIIPVSRNYVSHTHNGFMRWAATEII